ncbi:MAG: transcription-repair coupling factor [Myxococcales bacterium]|nr:transcription-repair coupling factor [Myxococcales bacterium]
MDESLSGLSAKQGLATVADLLGAHRIVRVHNSVGAFQALLCARLASLPGHARPLVAVTADETAAQALTRDLRFFMQSIHAADDPTAASRVAHLPWLETTPWADISPDRRAIVQRMSTLFRLSQGLSAEVLVASAPALARRAIPRASYGDLVDVLQKGEELDRDKLMATLVKGGYTRMPVVEDAGTFAVRGGVIDAFVPLYRFPLRIELFGDLVESIRFFDPDTQRTMRAVDEAYVHPVRETVLTRGNRLRDRILEAGDRAEQPSSKTRAMLDQIEKGEDFFGIEALTPAFHERMASIAEYLPAESLLFVDEPDACIEALATELDEGRESYEARLAEHRIAFPPDDFYLSTAELQAIFDKGKRVEAHQLEVAGSSIPVVRFAVDQHRDLAIELQRARAEKHEELLRPLAKRLRDWRDEGIRALVAVPNVQHAERLESLLKGYQIIPHLHRVAVPIDLFDERAQRTNVEIVLGSVGHGFELPLDGVALISEQEIFGEKSARRSPKKAKRPFAESDFKHLEPGAFVVHKLHGVGIYKGLTKLPLRSGGKEVAVDFLQLEYDGGALYLPVWRVNEVQAYAGAEGIKPKLDRLGGETWKKTRGKIAKEVRQLAEELLQLYAQRRALPGTSYALSAHLETTFREFEATFPFEETPDQQKAIDEVVEDLDQQRPMDRLVCGDVGYGKTEVALRAALKVVLAGKQVAVLAPTTVLVEQHAVNFAARYQGLPVKVASLSRFKTKQEQAEVLKGVAEGKIDVVVGTHRLLSNDVRFKELGLLIVDEEQRFGVTHKERLKKLKTQVDCLTLTATPIPRTLHMALMGLRDLSIITTPPADRLAIRTMVSRYNDAVVLEGVKRELARGGQIFFVHNRVEDIYEWSAKLRTLLPDLRIVVGHGQMPSEELERVMVDFVDGKADMLLCTTIIESGLDIPRANTMFVNRADMFGLAQLYQLRGRIGRSRERAFCYLLIPPEETLSTDAKKRLAVLQRFTELGAGFQIASHDLEIRGAGDLLGAKQSGAIAAVGFETYTAMLEEAVASLKGEAIHEETDPELTCDLPGFIPDDYLPDVGQRLEFYRRLSSSRDEEEVREIVIEITDRYGPPPPEVDILADIMIVKGLGRKLGARAIELTEMRLGLMLADNTPLEPASVMRLVNAKNSPWKLTPDMRLLRTFLSAERDQRVQLAKKLLSDLLATAKK